MSVYIKKIFLAVLVGVVAVACSTQSSVSDAAVPVVTESGAEKLARDFLWAISEADAETVMRLSFTPEELAGELEKVGISKAQAEERLREHFEAELKKMQQQGMELKSVDVRLEAYDAEKKTAKASAFVLFNLRDVGSGDIGGTGDMGTKATDTEKSEKSGVLPPVPLRYTDYGWKVDFAEAGLLRIMKK